MSSYNKVIVNCIVCDRELATTAKRQQDGRGKYCSRKCLHISQRKPKVITCIVCGTTKTITSRQYANRKGLFCSYACRGIYMSGSNHAMWKGGVYVKKDTGYVMEYDPARRKHVRQHRLVMERHLGRELLPNEIPHHRNEQKGDNLIGNLLLMTSKKHKSMHAKRKA